jgi:seryl-tRNA synthetase
MSLEQYKDSTRKELWDILQIQSERLVTLEKEFITRNRPAFKTSDIQLERIAELESDNKALIVEGDELDKRWISRDKRIAELEKYAGDLVAEQIVSEILAEERIAELEKERDKANNKLITCASSIAELKSALDKLIDRAQQVDSWESFPESWIDEAYETLKEN